MTSKFQVAQNEIRGMMSKAAKGTPQLSETWGSRRNKRDVFISHGGDQQYHASLCSWGMEEQTITGDYNYVHNMAASFLAEAGQRSKRMYPTDEEIKHQLDQLDPANDGDENAEHADTQYTDYPPRSTRH
jgi:hypothetical protein